MDQELSIGSCIKVMDGFSKFLKRADMPGRINLTGGDPLLKEGIFELIGRARKLGMLVGILGNPGHLDLETARRLRKAGIFRYQLSIDGLGPTHDSIRGRPGHFEETLEGLDILKRAGLPSVVMFTLSKENASELSSVAELAAEKGVRVFDFARLVPHGRGRSMSMLGAREYRDVLIEVLETYDRLEKSGTGTIFGRKEALWNLLYSELDMFRTGSWDGLIHSGCGAGSKVLTVLADGTVYPCRRLPLEMGRVPRDNIEDVFFKARTQVELRDVSRFEKCRDCKLLPYCRGCPGVALGATGDPFAPDPQCWKEGPDELTEDDKARIWKGFVLKDHGVWSGKATRQCSTCDGVCGGCASVCGGCSEVCASCGGGPDA